MIITDIRSRGQNIFLGTDSDKSFVLNGFIVPVMMGTEVVELADNQFQIGDVTLQGRYDEYQNVWDLKLETSNPENL